MKYSLPWLSKTANYPKHFPTTSSQSEFSFLWMHPGFSAAIFVNTTIMHTNESSQKQTLADCDRWPASELSKLRELRKCVNFDVYLDFVLPSSLPLPINKLSDFFLHSYKTLLPFHTLTCLISSWICHPKGRRLAVKLPWGRQTFPLQQAFHSQEKCFGSSISSPLHLILTGQHKPSTTFA